MSVLVLTQVLGIYIIAEGILAILDGSDQRDSLAGMKTILRGVLAILLGIFVFGHSGLGGMELTATFVPYVIAFIAIISGILEIRCRNQGPQGDGRRGLAVSIGGCAGDQVFGLILLIVPLALWPIGRFHPRGLR